MMANENDPVSAVVEAFKLQERLRGGEGSLRDSFKHPATGEVTENTIGISVPLLRALVEYQEEISAKGDSE